MSWFHPRADLQSLCCNLKLFPTVPFSKILYRHWPKRCSRDSGVRVKAPATALWKCHDSVRWEAERISFPDFSQLLYRSSSDFVLTQWPQASWKAQRQQLPTSLCFHGTHGLTWGLRMGPAKWFLSTFQLSLVEAACPRPLTQLSSLLISISCHVYSLSTFQINTISGNGNENWLVKKYILFLSIQMIITRLLETLKKAPENTVIHSLLLSQLAIETK